MVTTTLYGATQVAGLVGVTPETIKNWEDMGLVPRSSRMGLIKKRVWSKPKVERILEFAKDNGYHINGIGG